MMPWLRWKSLEPLVLLLIVGALLGTIFPLGKLAQGQGVSAPLYTFMTAAGASLVLGGLTTAAGLSLRPDREALRFSLIAGQLTFAVPWGCVVLVVPKVGSALPAIVQSMTPIATLVAVYALAVEKPGPLRILGLFVGLVGVLVITVSRTSQPGEDASLGWYAAMFITPVALAFGNVYRSMKWPKTCNHPLQLATWSLMAAALSVGALMMFWRDSDLNLAQQLSVGLPYFAAQGLATGAGYACFFRLQRIGGPIYVSQLSFVNTAAGVLFAVTLLSETLPAWSGLALTLIFVSVMMINWAR